MKIHGTAITPENQAEENYMAAMNAMPDAKARAGRVKREIQAAGGTVPVAVQSGEKKQWPPRQPPKGPSPIDRDAEKKETETQTTAPLTMRENVNPSSTTSTTVKSSKKREMSSQVIDLETFRGLSEQLKSCVIDEDTG